MKTCPHCAGDIKEAALFCTHCARELAEAPARPSSRGRWVAIGAATIGVLLLGLIVSALFRTDATQQAVSAAALTPMTLTDVVESLPANSWRAIPLKLPYSGTVQVQVDVTRGNPLNMYLVSAEELSAFQENDAAAPRTFEGFNASKTKTFRGERAVNAGDYYFLIMNPSAGELSPATSDVAVQVHLRP